MTRRFPDYRWHRCGRMGLALLHLGLNTRTKRSAIPEVPHGCFTAQTEISAMKTSPSFSAKKCSARAILQRLASSESTIHGSCQCFFPRYSICNYGLSIHGDWRRYLALSCVGYQLCLWIEAPDVAVHQKPFELRKASPSDLRRLCQQSRLWAPFLNNAPEV